MLKNTVTAGIFTLLFLFYGCFSPLQGDEPAQKSLRLASYNIQICRGMERRSYDADDFQNSDRTAEALERLNADVIGLQEVDRRTNRSRGADQIAILAEKTGFVPTYGRAIDLPGGEYGIGILSKKEPVSVKNIPLPGQEERRTLLVAEFDDFVFFDVHFSLTAESRTESAAIVNAELARWNKPVIFVGDLNVTSDAEREKLFGEHWTVLTDDAPTFPADQPRIRLDYIQIADPTGKIPVNDRRWTDAITNRRVADEPCASDHRPVWVELRWPIVE